MKTRPLFVVIFVIVMVALGIKCYMLNIDVKQNCTGYLKQAADANTVETAKVPLDKAIKYLEDNHITQGYTSVWYRTPEDDISFWYNNIKTARNQLDKVTDSTSELEKSNLLLKLRETLLDHGSNGDKITCPDGLSRYPDNKAWALFFAVLLVLFVFLYSLGS